jgi:hypothetical protein
VRGYNAGFYRAADGGELCLADFEDAGNNNSIISSDEQTSRDAAKAVELETLIEDIIAKNGFLPQDFYANYYAERKPVKCKHNAQKTVINKCISSDYTVGWKQGSDKD